VSTDALKPKGTGAALALGAVAAAVAALPDVRRVATGGLSPGVAWVALTGSTALVLGPLLVAARTLRVAASGVRGVLVGVGLAAGPLAVLGEVLKLETHHRPLGAATFGFLALFMVLGSILVAVRVLSWASEAATAPRRLATRILAIAAATSLGAVFLRAVSAAGYNHDVLDACRLLVVAALANRALDVPLVATLARRAGVAAWVLLVLFGLVAARGPMRGVIRERAPVLGGPAAWL
jgi:hypothetical protein